MSDLEQDKIEVRKKITRWLNEEALNFQEETDPYLTLKFVVLPS
jgi:hypothetical protein